MPANPARRPLIAGNWKMNKTYGGAVSLTQDLVDRVERSWKQSADILVCPPYTALRGVSNVIAFDHSFVAVGAQDCSWHEDGAFTGQISISMLKDLDCTYCIVGHSERRTLLGETSEEVARKVCALAAAGVTPIVCVGEDRATYDAGDTVAYVTGQVRDSLAGYEPSSCGLVVAYEPIWAIGSGLVPSPEHAQAVAQAIREEVAALFGDKVARELRVLYGGSVRPANASQFTSGADVDGVLVGGASLDATSFYELAKAIIEAAG